MAGVLCAHLIYCTVAQILGFLVPDHWAFHICVHATCCTWTWLRQHVLFSKHHPQIHVCRNTQGKQKCIICWLCFLFMNSDVLFSFVAMREKQGYNNWPNFRWLKNDQQIIYNSPCIIHEPKCYPGMLVYQKCYHIMLLLPQYSLRTTPSPQKYSHLTIPKISLKPLQPQVTWHSCNFLSR